jgi:hypothetical protein
VRSAFHCYSPLVAQHHRIRSHEHREAARGALEALERELQLLEGENALGALALARDERWRRDPARRSRSGDFWDSSQAWTRPYLEDVRGGDDQFMPIDAL